jgi:hypothetical protein
MGKSPMNVVVPLGVGEGQAGMAGTDRAPVVLCQAGASLLQVRALRSRDTRYPPLCMAALESSRRQCRTRTVNLHVVAAPLSDLNACGSSAAASSRIGDVSG